MQSPLFCIFRQGFVPVGACLTTGFASVRLARYAAFGAFCGLGCISVAGFVGVFLDRGYSSRRWPLLALRRGLEQRAVRTTRFSSALLVRNAFRSFRADNMMHFSLSRRTRRLLRKHCLAQPLVDIHVKTLNSAGRAADRAYPATVGISRARYSSTTVC
ncbi:uncharacterized protein CC84DRAFT_413607 [Paraphaeosphaeria sporulosa]|uniref:Uncharacterized protein n=1 Tax=Paraphaeosphaeria sporulosa TaxID=1460663 RepID=A0A177BWD9_9PLEO|nr:uncharacterized protein CC84DRAFT_413607 [Paraphaeosphaeria sporulosa]OAF98988.1 hypothetical protein CC84DRAFT_413607 [Paraphaeosphaeria sporulosa]